jgi:glycosyltransferase involved in cell wall biosynthesis
MRAFVREHGLGSVVTFMGNLDFESELLPFMRSEVDLFVCCHRQGDPSCTYLETLACGVPIAGYGNEAWRGLAERSSAGWVTPMKRPRTLASKIASLTDAEIERRSFNGLQFARAHTFETEFERRIEHLKALMPSRLTANR